MSKYLVAALLLAAGGAISLAAATPQVAKPAASLPGEAIYAAQCESCHGGLLQGGSFGPSLRSAGFTFTWASRPEDLLKYVSETMPPNAGGSLSEADYAAVVDYVFQFNAQSALPRNDVPAAGPQPLAESAFKGALYDREMAHRAKLLAGLTPVTAEMLRTPPEGDWLTLRRTQDDLGFSPLSQIDKSNVAGLKLKWSWSMRDGRNEIAPIVHDGVMFVNSAYDVEALDAATGTLLWRYTREIPREYRGALNKVQRNMAISGKTLLISTADRHVVALDVASGKVVWDTEIIPDEIPRAVLSAGPTVAGGVIVQGTSMSAMSPGGAYVVGLDAETGKVLWRFNTIPDEGSASKTWNGTPWIERTGGAVWVAPSYDPETDTVFFGTGGTYDLSKLLEPGPADESSDALYTNATVALDARTGNLRWYYQHMPREVWDLDEAYERMLVDLAVDGRDRRLAVSVGKLGILDAVDRDTGEYVFSIDLGMNNIVTAINPKTGERTVDPAKVPTPNKPVHICPSPLGARNWMSTAYNPVTGTLYLPLENICMDYWWSAPGGEFDSNVDNGWAYKAPPGGDGNLGLIRAVDLSTRKTLWNKAMRPVPSSSLLTTAGGLLFAGSSDRYFMALDQRTGQDLWRTRLGAAPNSTPVSYNAGGEQLIAVISGAGGDQASQTQALTPEVEPPISATTIYVFGL